MEGENNFVNCLRLVAYTWRFLQRRQFCMDVIVSLAVMSELIESPNDDSTKPRTEGDTTSLSPLVNSADSQYGPWSECVNGMRQRKRICVGGRACGKEVQGCTGNDLTDLDFGDNDGQLGLRFWS